MRLDKSTLRSITGLQTGKAQARWFRDYLGATVPCDRQGPILTQSAYEALVARANGVLTRPSDNSEPRPTVKLRAIK